MPTSPIPTWQNRPRRWRQTSSRQRGFRPTGGFTLLELLLVVTILALLSGVVATRIGGVQRKAGFEHALSQWEFIDQQLRLDARRHHRPAELRVDLGKGRLTQVRLADNNEQGSVQSLSGGVRITKYMSATRSTDSGEIAIPYGPHGTTDTFAAKFKSPSGKHQWVLVAGLTGQMTRFDKDSEIEHVLQSIAPRGLHTR